jgi:hypothetical protein
MGIDYSHYKCPVCHKKLARNLALFLEHTDKHIRHHMDYAQLIRAGVFKDLPMPERKAR